MVLRVGLKVIILFLFLSLLFGCEKSPSDPEPENPKLPSSVDITSPSSAETYWTDKSIPCVSSQPDYKDKTTWLVDGEPVACADGELDTRLPEGQHNVGVRIAEGSDSVEQSVTIKVKEGFSVALVNPKDGSENFVGEKVDCEADINPEKYSEHLRITVDGQSCVDGEADLTQAGESVFRAFAQIDDRTEADEATITVKPVIAGKVYPQTSDGVQDGAGFSVTLMAGGEVIDAETDGEGNFSIRSEAIDELGSEEVTLEVAASGDFYGSKAVLPASELLALAEAQNLGFILAPRRWYIRDGKLAGNSAKLQLRAAFTRVITDDATSSFYMLEKVFGKYKYISVISENLPLPVAFNRAESSADITKSDSTVFWKRTNELESHLGYGDIFFPAILTEVPTTANGIHVFADGSNDGTSTAGLTVDEGGDYIIGGRIDLDSNHFGKPIQKHEQGHSLGFGHASQWDGIMTLDVFINRKTGERHDKHPGSSTDNPTITEVIHKQVYMKSFNLQFAQSISFGVLEWMQALGIKGLPETTSSTAKVAGKHFNSYELEVVHCRIH